MRVLATFGGKFGDILWSLATVKSLYKKYGDRISFRIMPQYRSLLPLLNEQYYIQAALTQDDWICTGSPHGDQPWQAPVNEKDWDAVHHLTYRQHPMNFAPSLVESIAMQQGLDVSRGPFICCSIKNIDQKNQIAVGFNEADIERKAGLVKYLIEKNPEFTFVDVSKLSWREAAVTISESNLFLGCRSALAVVAHGVGQKVVSFETVAWRLNPLYGCPWGKETLCTHEDQVEMAIQEHFANEVIRA